MWIALNYTVHCLHKCELHYPWVNWQKFKVGQMWNNRLHWNLSHYGFIRIRYEGFLVKRIHANHKINVEFMRNAHIFDMTVWCVFFGWKNRLLLVAHKFQQILEKAIFWSETENSKPTIYKVYFTAFSISNIYFSTVSGSKLNVTSL